MTTKQMMPEGVEELSDILKASSAGDRVVVPVGGGTALAIGNRASAEPAYVSLAALNGILSYQPADLTLSVLAGTPVAAIQETLASQGQELPIDVPLPSQATIGGLVATGFAGPRRLGSGSLKDILLGCAFVTGDGTVAKAGGSVVKNVSGFEIPRLLHGSWGSLAILTSINLKVTPIPKADLTLVREDVPPAIILDLTHRIRIGMPSAVAIETDRGAGGVRMAVRLMGRAGALEVQAGELRRDFGFEAEAPASFWHARHDRLATAPDGVQLVISSRPRHVVDALVTVSQRLGSAREVAMSPGLGVVRMIFDSLDATTFWQAVDVPTLPGGAQVSIEFAPDGWGTGVDRWGNVCDGLETMRSVKAAFDPRYILNRGRLFI